MNKRYLTANNYYQEKYHKKVIRIPLDGNFTCPNIDGTKGINGCSYCLREKSTYNSLSLFEQFQAQKQILEKKWTHENLYIPYFQFHSNTYASPERLRKLYYEALNLDKDIIGLSISTRPDCFNNEIYDLLAEINLITDLTIELGLQTINERSSRKINRCHTLIEFENCLAKLKEIKIKVIVHVINGLPDELEEDMLNTIKYLKKFNLHGIKFHMLFLCNDTKLGDEYLIRPFHVLSLDEYVGITVKQLRMLNPETIIYRITGDAPKEKLIAPLWSLKKFVVINEIDKKMRNLNAFQGDMH